VPRFALTVPYAERAEAKRLGARWDAKARTWYVPLGADIAPFSRWQPRDEAINIRAASYFLARATRECWKCHGETVIHGFAVRLPFQFIAPGDLQRVWQDADHSAVLSYVTILPARVVERVKPLAPLLTPDDSRWRNGNYWMNHCEHCGAKLGDQENVEEHNAPLNPCYVTSLSKLVLLGVDEPFEARATIAVRRDIDPLALALKIPFHEMA